MPLTQQLAGGDSTNRHQLPTGPLGPLARIIHNGGKCRGCAITGMLLCLCLYVCLMKQRFEGLLT